MLLENLRAGEVSLPARHSMVWRGMGLLDDAIREHLELRRRRGADPGLVAHEEREAFGPVQGLADPHAVESVDPYTADPHMVDSQVAEVLAPESGGGHESGFSHVGQETAELDMRSVLGESDDRDPSAPVAAGRPAEPSQAPLENDQLDDALDEGADHPVISPDQERLWLEGSSVRDADLDT
jgi:hypothetical protein